MCEYIECLMHKIILIHLILIGYKKRTPLSAFTQP